MARREGKCLVYTGKVENGFSDSHASELVSALEPLRIKRQQLTTPMDKPKARWVDPVLSAEIVHRGGFDCTRLRQASL